jgi:hypothetical protein
MRYLEYIYLIGSVILAVYIATNYKHLDTYAVIGLGIGTGLMAFMYSFRRSQRLMMEKMAERDAQEEADIPDDEDHVS